MALKVKGLVRLSLRRNHDVFQWSSPFSPSFLESSKWRRYTLFLRVIMSSMRYLWFSSSSLFSIGEWAVNRNLSVASQNLSFTYTNKPKSLLMEQREGLKSQDRWEDQFSFEQETLRKLLKQRKLVKIGEKSSQAFFGRLEVVGRFRKQ